MALTRRTFLRSLGAFAGAIGIGLTVTRPQQGFRTDYYSTFTVKGPDNSYLMGYRGSQFLETGFVYAPYIPLYRTPAIHAYVPPKFMEKYANLTRGKNLLQLA
jgi:hypothetical protein